MKPLCCVLMPSGMKRLPAGPVVDFEAVYSTLVEPGMLALGVPRLEASGDALRVELAGAHVYAAGRDVACTFEVEADGRARALDPCGD